MRKSPAREGNGCAAAWLLSRCLPVMDEAVGAAAKDCR